MAAVTAGMVKTLREKSGAGMLDCKKALDQAGGDVEKALEELRVKGVAKAQKKSSRATKQGLVHAYIHHTGSVGVLLELNCETDFVARNPDFKDLANDICLHIAARAPLSVSKDDLDAAVLEKEREIYRKAALEEGKPEQIVDKIAEGKINKFVQENCLLEQPFVKDEDVKIGDLLQSKIATIGENMSISRFVRYQLGESSESE